MSGAEIPLQALPVLGYEISISQILEVESNNPKKITRKPWKESTVTP
jgi:hypothetical protein